MKIYTLIFLALFLISQKNCFSQTKAEKDQDLANYKTALQHSDEAGKAWVNNNFLKAEKLFALSSDTYLTSKGLNELANLKLKIGDIKGANLAWNAILRLALSYSKLITSSKSYISTKELLVPILQEQGEINAKNGNIQQAYKAYLNLEKYLSNTEEFGDKYYTLSIYASQTDNFETAQRAIDSLKVFYRGKNNVQKGSGVASIMMGGLIKKALKKGASDMQLQILVAEINLHIALGEYQIAIKVADRLEEEDNGLNTTWKGVARLAKAECYALIGDQNKAQEFLDLALKHAAFSKTSPNVRYVTGLINLLNKDYNNAIANINGEMNYKAEGFMVLNKHTAWGKYRYFAKRAEAYTGLLDYEKAKQDYESALLFYPDYQPAINGLAKLNSTVAREKRVDILAPKIEITSTGTDRGLRISSVANDYLVKGLAIDPSGVNSVKINDVDVFFQAAGAFWGNVTLKEGVNRIVVKATDVVGNTGEYTFEIEKQTTPQQTDNPIVAPVEKEGKNYALLIASQNYDDTSIPSLENPIPDAVKLKIILKNDYNFDEGNIETLFNPIKSDIKKAFLSFSEILQAEDNLVIFYAGHGIWVDKEKKGYWLLSEAKRNDSNTWLPNRDVLDLIAKLPAKHTLLITDACFSGSVFKTRGLKADAPIALREMDAKISRVAITSGNDTEVPDESVFMKYLVKALSENKEKYLTAQKMFINQIIEAVMTETKTEPRYGTLELAGHVGGDFIFSKK